MPRWCFTFRTLSFLTNAFTLYWKVDSVAPLNFACFRISMQSIDLKFSDGLNSDRWSMIDDRRTWNFVIFLFANWFFFRAHVMHFVLQRKSRLKRFGLKFIFFLLTTKYDVFKYEFRLGNSVNWSIVKQITRAKQNRSRKSSMISKIKQQTRNAICPNARP